MCLTSVRLIAGSFGQPPQHLDLMGVRDLGNAVSLQRNKRIENAALYPCRAVLVREILEKSLCNEPTAGRAFPGEKKSKVGIRAALHISEHYPLVET
jgi:hypothetical protein